MPLMSASISGSASVPALYKYTVNMPKYAPLVLHIKQTSMCGDSKRQYRRLDISQFASSEANLLN